MTTPYLFNADAELTTLHEESFSIAFWLRPSEGPSYVQTTLLIGPAWKIFLNNNGTLTFRIKNSIIPNESSVTSSEMVIGADWNHIVAVYNKDDTTISIYVNDEIVSAAYTNVADSSLSQYETNFQLGVDDFIYTSPS